MYIYAVFCSPGSAVPCTPATTSLRAVNGAPRAIPVSGGRLGGLAIECSSRPKKKATAHHMKTRPRKTQPWDVRRKPTVYAPLPPLPPDWTLVASSEDGAAAAGAEAAPPSPAPQTPVSSG